MHSVWVLVADWLVVAHIACCAFDVGQVPPHVMVKPWSQSTKDNLSKPIASLVDGDGSVLTVNDKKLAGPLRVRLRFTDIMKE